MQNIPAGAEFRFLTSRLDPLPEVRTHIQSKELKEFYHESLSDLQLKESVQMWGKEMSGRQAIWNIANARLALIDNARQPEILEYVKKNIENAKNFIVATQPLIEAQNQFLADKKAYHDRQEKVQGASVSVTIGARIYDKVEEAIIRGVGYESPTSPHVIPVATLLTLDVIHMGRILDTARDEFGHIDKDMLQDSLVQGTEWFNPRIGYRFNVHEQETRKARTKMQNVLSTPSMRKIQKGGNRLINDLPRLDSRTSAQEKGELLELVKAAKIIVQDEKICKILLESGLWDEHIDFNYQVKYADRIIEYMKQEGSLLRVIRPDGRAVSAMVFLAKRVLRLQEAQKSVTDKINRALNEYVEFDEKFAHEQHPEFIGKELAKKITQDIQVTDILFMNDAWLRECWGYVVSSMHNLTQTYSEVKQDVAHLLVS